MSPSPPYPSKQHLKHPNETSGSSPTMEMQEETQTVAETETQTVVEKQTVTTWTKKKQTRATTREITTSSTRLLSPLHEAVVRTGFRWHRVRISCQLKGEIRRWLWITE
ncbi:hypothetical protein LXL04_010244 [Taraxacum kok-saghyz]